MNDSLRAARAGRRAPTRKRNDHDPLFFEFDLPLTGTYYPLGFTFEIATNSPDVLLGAEESWRHFKKRFSAPPFRLQMGILEGKSKKRPPLPLVKGQRDMIVNVADAENFVVSNKDFAFGWLTKAAVASRAYLRYCFLEGTFYVMAVPKYLTSIHAACVAHRGSGVLLCGDCQAGKSSLAYACARSGWSFLCDDSAHVVRENAGRVVIGNPYQIRFRESALDLFPELRHGRISQHLTEKLSIELIPSDFPEISLMLESHVDFIVMLNRRPGPARLVRRTKESVQGWFGRSISWARQDIRQAQRASLENLLSADIFELQYSDFDTAIARLHSMVEAGPSRPADLVLAGGNGLNV